MARISSELGRTCVRDRRKLSREGVVEPVAVNGIAESDVLDRASRLLKEQVGVIGDAYTLSVVSTAGNTCDVVRVQTSASDFVLRMPRVPWTSARISTEAEILRRACRAKVNGPRVKMVGHPTDWYPYYWLLQTYIPGRTLTPDAPQEVRCDLQVQRELLARVEWPQAPPCARGRSIANEAMTARARLGRWIGATNRQRLRLARLLERASSLPPPAPVLVHGDLKPGNVICSGSNHALIDFSLAGIGERWIDDASMLGFDFAWSGGVAAGLGLRDAQDVVGVLAWATVIALEIVTTDDEWVRPDTLARNERRLERVMCELD
jgi:aminoglycoside phosphotransferase (APT) family kinase protein